MTESDLQAIEARCNAATLGPAGECGKPGPCGWCDSLQLTEDLLWFENGKEPEYEGEAEDRGSRLAREVRRLEGELEALQSSPRYSTAAVDALLADLDEVIRLDQRVTREFCLNDSVAAVRASREGAK